MCSLTATGLQAAHVCSATCCLWALYLMACAAKISAERAGAFENNSLLGMLVACMDEAILHSVPILLVAASKVLTSLVGTSGSSYAACLAASTPARGGQDAATSLAKSSSRNRQPGALWALSASARTPCKGRTLKCHKSPQLCTICNLNLSYERSAPAAAASRPAQTRSLTLKTPSEKC